MGAQEKILLIQTHVQYKTRYGAALQEKKEEMFPIPVLVHGALYYHHEEPVQNQKATFVLQHSLGSLDMGLKHTNFYMVKDLEYGFWACTIYSTSSLMSKNCEKKLRQNFGTP